MKNIAVYAGTFDPVTYGHLDVIESALPIFEKIIIAVAASPSKKPLFSLAEREQLIRASLPTEKVAVFGFDSLLLDFAKAHHANVILRGLRSVTDFDYEFQLSSMNRRLNANIQSIFLMPSESHMYISSSLVREIAALNGDVSPFVPPQVADALRAKYLQTR